MKTLLIVLALAGAGIEAQAATITLAGPESVNGGSFDVSVEATGVFDAPHVDDGFLAYGFDVAFDPALLSYAGETAGPLFDDISGNAGFGADVGGTADAGFLEAGDFTEPLVLAILHFDSAGVGSANISVSADNSNPDQGLIYFTSSDSFSAATGVDIAPEPGTLVPGVCAAALIAWRKRIFHRV
jgi:hypothetical protein